MKLSSLFRSLGFAVLTVGCHSLSSPSGTPEATTTLRADEAGPFDHSHAALTQILKQHVQAGRFDYAGLHRDASALEDYLDRLALVSHEEFDGWPEPDQLAYLINIYNAATLKLVNDNYPLDSIKDIGGLLGNPWKMPVVRLFGERVTLNHVEHDMLRANYEEPRIHFAVNCASISCPALRHEAYRGDVLDRQLEEQGRAFLRDPSKNRIDLTSRTLYLSPIFHWFKGDFTAQSESLAAFVAPYLEPEARRHVERGGFELKRSDYDWNLNAP